MEQQSTDQELLQNMREDDEMAFRSLFDRYYRLLCYASYKVYPDEHKSRDFAQEVFLSLWNKRKDISIHSSLSAFLRRAVVNKTIDFIRAQRFNFEEVPDLKESTDSPNKKMEYEELKDLIHQTAEQLPERCRMIFMMSRFEELSHKEIAVKLGISEKTIENQITKALKILRAAIGPYLSESKLILLFLFFS